ncbi:primosomal protein N' [Geobacter sp. DSM 9736]|uniref:replication restart helicase PriA n=1 Tax=Geobacter sp. DSM 9736 TaxID=1277350 RepID=UPI000B50DDE9|nr:primosomal protein N' [Geobacter sp. DSM 9736]SNB47703.1 replication restart DNA helicase PriA [Geobacter sp. DSM 9736]
MSSSSAIIEVAIPVPLDTTFHYAVPAGLVPSIQPGKRVLVPFGRRTVTGYILDIACTPRDSLKEVIEVLDQEPLFTREELGFFRWCAAYYLHPLGEVLKAALPAGINITGRRRKVCDAEGEEVPTEVLTGGKRVRTETFHLAASVEGDGTPVRGKSADILAFLRLHGEARRSLLTQTFGACYAQLARLEQRGLVATEQREFYRDPFREEVVEHDMPLPLNSCQAEALRRIRESLDCASFASYLLHGVTGSGKTEIYLQAISHVVEQGGTALVLVPEIALTPQLVTRFRRRFTCGIAVLHSGLSDGERYDEWRRIRQGRASIVIGARSAIFAPLSNIRIIVVDEEHDSSYKQSEGFRYNGRDLALVRGKMEQACVLLGSATPLVTTWHAAAQGKHAYLSLPERVRSLPMPETELVDMRGRRGETLSCRLQEAVGWNLEQGGQAILFLNRRGFATYVVCEQCGHVLNCPNCAVTLTYHRGRQRHFCHYCDHSVPAPSVCPSCESPEIGLLGRGTERVEEEVAEMFPNARVGRMDRDTTSRKGSHAAILKEVEEGNVDLLIGTQMIAKGHDFPGVTLVGVVSADASVHLPDFRSAERTFQLLTQVMGRAGRGDRPGRVIVQTLLPDHYAIFRALNHDYAGFCAEELDFRRDAGYPPFSHLAAVILSSTSKAEAERQADQAASTLRRLRRELKGKVEILGPATAPLGKIRGRYRWQILLKGTRRSDVHSLAAKFRKTFVPPAVVRVNIDIDPVDML